MRGKFGTDLQTERHTYMLDRGPAFESRQDPLIFE